MQNAQINTSANFISTAHYFDKYTAQLFLENGQVMTVGKPEDFYPGGQDAALERMERILKTTGVIAASDEILCCM